MAAPLTTAKPPGMCRHPLFLSPSLPRGVRPEARSRGCQDRSLQGPSLGARVRSSREVFPASCDHMQKVMRFLPRARVHRRAATRLGGTSRAPGTQRDVRARRNIRSSAGGSAPEARSPHSIGTYSSPAQQAAQRKSVKEVRCVAVSRCMRYVPPPRFSCACCAHAGDMPLKPRRMQHRPTSHLPCGHVALPPGVRSSLRVSRPLLQGWPLTDTRRCQDS